MWVAFIEVPCALPQCVGATSVCTLSSSQFPAGSQHQLMSTCRLVLVWNPELRMTSQELRSPGALAGTWVLVSGAAVAGAQLPSPCWSGGHKLRSALLRVAQCQKEQVRLGLLTRCITNPKVSVWNSEFLKGFNFFFAFYAYLGLFQNLNSKRKKPTFHLIFSLIIFTSNFSCAINGL